MFNLLAIAINFIIKTIIYKFLILIYGNISWSR